MLYHCGKAVSVILGVWFLVGCGGLASTTIPKTTTSPTPAKPSPPALENLGEETEIAGYIIRPPKGYTKTTPATRRPA